MDAARDVALLTVRVLLAQVLEREGLDWRQTALATTPVLAEESPPGCLVFAFEDGLAAGLIDQLPNRPGFPWIAHREGDYRDSRLYDDVGQLVRRDVHAAGPASPGLIPALHRLRGRTLDAEAN